MQGKKYISSIWRRKCKYNNMKKLKDLYYPKSNRTFTTSSLDTESELIVQEALEKLITNRTTIVIARRKVVLLEAQKVA